MEGVNLETDYVFMSRQAMADNQVVNDSKEMIEKISWRRIITVCAPRPYPKMHQNLVHFWHKMSHHILDTFMKQKEYFTPPGSPVSVSHLDKGCGVLRRVEIRHCAPKFWC